MQPPTPTHTPALPRGGRDTLPTSVSADGMRQYGDVLAQALAANRARATQLRDYADEYQSLHALLTRLPERTRHTHTLVPLGPAPRNARTPPLAFVDGTLRHSNELLVLLGANTFARRSASQARAIVERRLDYCFEQQRQVEQERKELRSRLNAMNADVLPEFADDYRRDGIVEIRESVDEHDDLRAVDAARKTQAVDTRSGDNKKNNKNNKNKNKNDNGNAGDERTTASAAPASPTTTTTTTTASSSSSTTTTPSTSTSSSLATLVDFDVGEGAALRVDSAGREQLSDEERVRREQFVAFCDRLERLEEEETAAEAAAEAQAAAAAAAAAPGVAALAAAKQQRRSPTTTTTTTTVDDDDDDDDYDIDADEGEILKDDFDDDDDADNNNDDNDNDAETSEQSFTMPALEPIATNATSTTSTLPKPQPKAAPLQRGPPPRISSPSDFMSSMRLVNNSKTQHNTAAAAAAAAAAAKPSVRAAPPPAMRAPRAQAQEAPQAVGNAVVERESPAPSRPRPPTAPSTTTTTTGGGERPMSKFRQMREAQRAAQK